MLTNYDLDDALIMYLRNNAIALLDEYLTPGEVKAFEMYDKTNTEIVSMAEELFQVRDDFKEYVLESRELVASNK